jgi:filamentous hemagglutinin family protein
MRRATRLKAVYPVSIVAEAGPSPSRRRLRPALLALSIAAAFTSLPIASQSILPVHRADVVGTSARAVNAAGTQLTVTTTNGVGTNHSAINWQSFSIGAGNTTQFVQPSATSTSINRVVTNTPSQIYGTLSSNGKLVLVNQSGITVGAGAVVDTAGFTASVLGMSDTDAVAGRMRFSADSLGNGTGALVVQGNVIARGGDVVLIAPSVEVAKTAVVESQGGAVVLAAGQKVEVTGRGLEGIVMQVQAPGDSAVNLGTLRGDAVGIFASQLKHSGLIQAVGATSVGGKVVLKANDVAEITGRIEAQRITTTGTNGGDVTVNARYAVVTGAIDASGQQGGNVTIDAQSVLQAAPISVAGITSGGVALVRGAQSVVQTTGASINADATQGAGGSIVVQADSGEGSGGSVLTSATLSASGAGGGAIKVLGSTIRLQGAQISADGDADGGSLLVGGNKHGNDPLTPNSQYLYVNSATALSARSRRAGNGGEVVLWSDGTTRFFGSIDARGASDGGNGGLVEVSGKDAVQFAGAVLASGGPGGANGSLLLDPKNLTIANASGQLGVLELADPNSEANGAGDFGSSIVDIGNGRVLVTDPFDTAGGANAGALYIYDKASGSLQSALTGSHSGDGIGGGGYQFQGTSYVFKSGTWNGNFGAWTWINTTTGASAPGSGIISAANSLVGTAANDLVSASLSTPTSGRALLIAPRYGNGAGALATFTNAGFAGTLDSGNALVGSSSTDNIGNYGSSYLTGNYYAIFSANWGGNKGAITVIDTSQGLSGVVSATNSLVGSATGDFVGNGTSSLRQFNNGKVMVFSSQWGGGKGAFTVFDGVNLVKGTVDATTSLVGSTTSDGSNFFIQNCGASGTCTSYAFGSADYFLITNPYWNANSGSVTFLSKYTAAASSPTGTLSSANSLIGAAGDLVGLGGVSVMSGGSAIYVLSPSWSSGAGALTFETLTTLGAAPGLVSASNSIVGTAAGDFSGASVRTDFTAGSLVLIAPTYASGAGAMALLSPGAVGTLSSSNALVGSSTLDHLGSGGLTITDDSYYWILKSPQWNASRGAITIFEPVSATLPVGTISSTTNSWVGSNTGDQVGADMTFTQFSNHNAVVVNRRFGSGSPSATSGPGAITLINDPAMAYGTFSSANSLLGTLATDGAGITLRSYESSGYESGYSPYTSSIVAYNPAWNDYRGFVTMFNASQTLVSSPGLISGSNSLVGSIGGGASAGDRVGSYIGSIIGVNTATLVVRSPFWNTSLVTAAGAITFGNLSTGVMPTGPVSNANSLVGIASGDLATGNANLYVSNYDGSGLSYAYKVEGDHALLVASDYAGGKGAIVNIDLTSPATGTLSSSNALMGGSTTDHVGSGGVMAQDNFSGSRVLVFSPSLNSSAGAITSIDTSTASPVGPINASNSFVGNAAGDAVGNGGSSNVYEFANGNLLFITPDYTANGSVSSAGAMTLLAPTSVTGTIAPSNSLTGSSTGDFSGWSVLRYDQYGNTYYYGNSAFVSLPSWTNTLTSAGSAGAIVRLDATASAPIGEIDNTKAFAGTHVNDLVGSYGSISVNSDGVSIYASNWNSGNGLLAFTGLSSALTGNADSPTGASSVLGSAAGDLGGYQLIYGNAGYNGKRTLLASNYGGGAGAIFSIDIAAGFASGTLSASNALVGSSNLDHLGSGGYSYWGNNRILVGSPNWNNATGAMTLSDVNGVFATGTLGSGNSLVGAQANDRIGNAVGSSIVLGNGKLLLINRNWGIGSSTTSSGMGAITLLQNPAQASGVISAANSLVGVAQGDGGGFYAQTYYDGTAYNRVLVSNPNFNGGRGMVSQINGNLAASTTGSFNETNSLVGSNVTDHVGQYVTIDYYYGSNSITIRSPNWSGNAGAVTSFDRAGTLPTGFVSSVNSLVGAQAGDLFGSNSLTYNYSDTYFSTYNTTLGGNRGGVSFFHVGATGVLSPYNTVYGTSTAGGFISVQQDTSPLYRVRFSAGSGRVVYIDPHVLAPSGNVGVPPQAFGDAAASDVTITPQSITAMTNAGMDVKLQANNDIFVNAAVTTVPSAQYGGSLLLEAGRSIMLNANITTGGGDLGLYANSPGAQAAYRDPGQGGIVTAAGVTLSLGGGDLLARVGTGVAGAQGGSIFLGQVNGANAMLLQNLSTTGGAGIAQDAATYWDTKILGMETNADNGAIGTLAHAITFNGQAMAVKAGNAPVNIHHTGAQLYFDVPDNSPVNSPGPQQNSNPDPGFRGINLAGMGSLSLISDGDIHFNTFDNTPLTVSAQNVQIEAAGSVYVSGYLGSTLIKARGQLLLNAGKDILVEGGSAANAFAKVESAGKMQITAGKSFAIHGGSGAGAYATVDPTVAGATMDVLAPSIMLQGGTGAGAYAVLASAGPMTLSYQQLGLAAGSGVDADAVIISPNAQQLSTQSGKTFLGVGSPLNNGVTDAGFSALLPPEDPVAGQFLADANFISDFLDHYNDALLNQRRKSLRNEISLEQSCN